MENKYYRKIKHKDTGEIRELYCYSLNENIKIAFWETHDNWEILEVKQFVGKFKGVDYYDGDKVLVKGTKRVGNYETEIVRDSQGWTLKENKTYLNDNRCFTAIIEKL